MGETELFGEWVRSEKTWYLLGQVFLVVFATLLLDLVQKRMLGRLEKRVRTTTSLWDDALFDALHQPLSLLIWLLGLTFATQLVGEEADVELFQFVGTVRDVGIIIIITWVLIRFVRQMEQNMVRRAALRGEELDVTTADAVSKLLRISVIITAALSILQTLGISISGILAFGGIGGLAVGFAAKDLLANFFGGLMIYLDRPFAVGDWVRSPDRNIEGTVEKVGWRLTSVRTFDKRPLYVPNATFANIAVENPSRMTHRRIYETVGIRYEDAGKMGAIVADVKQMLQVHPEIDAEQTMIVNFNTFAPSSLDFFIYTFTKTTQWVHYHEVKQDVLLKVIDIIAAHGAEIAFPTSTVHLPDPITLHEKEKAELRV